MSESSKILQRVSLKVFSKAPLQATGNLSEWMWIRSRPSKEQMEHQLPNWGHRNFPPHSRQGGGGSFIPSLSSNFEIKKATSSSLNPGRRFMGSNQNMFVHFSKLTVSTANPNLPSAAASLGGHARMVQALGSSQRKGENSVEKCIGFPSFSVK